MFISNLIYTFLLGTQILGKSSDKDGAKNTLEEDVDSWEWNWFPYKPNSPEYKQMKEEFASNFKFDNCDDGVESIGIDFDPEDKRHSYNYLCLGNRTAYSPDLNREALLVEHFIAPAYVPPVKCLNESIKYEDVLPTFGAFRPLAPKYGTYQYLPPQRWLHSLAEGAVIMLYHPCAFSGQVTALQNTLKSCLYRHIITPSQALSPERPLALIAWGKCMQMSVVDEHLVASFIKQHSKHGPITKEHRIKNAKLYEAGLLSEAHLVTDMEDTMICGYMEM